jgi:HK97 family phage portal protein
LGLISWLVDRFGGPVSVSYNGDLFEEYEDLVGDIYIRELAFLSAVNLVANAVSKCEFKTFTKGKEEKGREYYLWNLEPNKNQNSSVFIHKLISKLYRNNECLVIDQSGQLLVADNFNRKPYALYEDVFTQVQVGDFTFDRSFAQSEVLYFNLTESDTKKVVDGLYNSYSKLITYSMKAYQKSRGTKGIFQYDTLPVAGTPERDAFDKLINEKIKKWLDGDSAALPLGRGQEWKELEKKTYSSESTRDIKALVDDISDFTARAFGIPPALLRGDVQDTSKAVDQLLTFCIDSLVDMIQEEINRKRNGYAGFSQGTYLKIDTKTMKHVDLLSVSTAIDKLISSGAFCVNDIRELVGEPVIEEDWANEHFITRNYMPFEEALKALKGGETD